MTYKYKLEQRVTARFPDGREVTGVVSHRRTLPGTDDRGNKLKTYIVLDDADTAHTLIPENWINPVNQLELSDA